MSGFVVDTEAMRAHAAALDGIAQGLSEAVDAAATSAMPDSAFGMFCSFLLLPLAAVQAAAAAGVLATGTAMDGTRAGIRGSAEAYDAVDAGVQRVMKAIEGALS